MNFFGILWVLMALILLATSVAMGQQRPATCKGKPGQPRCDGPLDAGNKRKSRCRKQANKSMWYYNAAMNRTCIQLDYKGCGGNANRWCTKQECETNCRR